MNVFIIPSWYPSASEPHTGIFFKEQAEALAYIFPDSKFAISTWGSHDPDLLLYAKDHLKNIRKLRSKKEKQPYQIKLSPDLTEYFTPAFTWTRSFLKGNIKRIVEANEKHFLNFKAEAGAVDVIHAHSSHPAGWVAMELAQKYKVPYIITEHMGPFPFESFRLKSGKLSPWLDKPMQNAFANIAVSPQLQQTLEQWGIPRVTYIPNLTNESFFKPDYRISRNNRPFTFFTLARLEEGKGIDYLLQALKLLSEDKPDIRLRVGGEGSQQQALMALTKKLGIADRVSWLGTINRQKALEEYLRCNAFVLPSLHETFSVVCIEAMACGKPIITTKCGGPESIVTPAAGLLVAPADTEALHQALNEMYSNYDNYSKDTIREAFCSRYSRSIVCQQIMEVYKAAVMNKL